MSLWSLLPLPREPRSGELAGVSDLGDIGGPLPDCDAPPVLLLL